jgi:hypothetical protein
METLRSDLVNEVSPVYQGPTKVGNSPQGVSARCTPRVVAVKPFVAERRTPVVIVHVVVRPLVLVLGVVRLRRRLQVRPPVADGGGPAIGASHEVWEPIEQAALAAVQADPAARAHLFGPRPRLARH